MPNVAPTGQLDSHFYEGRKHRADELGEFAVQRSNWRLAAFGGIAGMLLLSIGCLYLGAQPKLRPYYIEVDTCSGDARVVGEAPTSYTIRELTLKKHLRDFVQTVRGVSLDKPDMQRRLTEVFYQLTPKGKKLFEQFMTERNPMYQREPVLVEVTAVLLSTGATYDVRWMEKRYNDRMDLQATEVYRGLFTVVEQTPRGKDEMDHNPMGLFIDQFSWSRE